MSTTPPGYALTRQCDECPYRVDVPVTRWPLERFRALHLTCVLHEDAVMACHKTPPGSEQACVGFLAAEGDRLRWPRFHWQRHGEWSPEALVTVGPQHGSLRELVRLRREAARKGTR